MRLPTVRRLADQAGRVIAGRFLRDGLWIFGAYAVTIAAGLVSVRLFTELATQSVFGGANLLLGVLTLGTQTLLAPITQTQIRYHVGYKDAGSADAYTWRMARYTAGAAGTMAAVVALALLIWPSARAGAHVWVIFELAAWTAVSSYRSLLLNRVQAERRQKLYSLWLGGESVSTMVCTATVLYFFGTIEGYIAGQVLGTALTALMFGRLPPLSTARRLGPDDPDRETARLQIRRYGVPFAPFALLAWVSNQSDRYVLAADLSTTAVGQYVAAFGIASRLPSLVGGLLADLFKPALFEAENRSDFVRAKRLLAIWLATLAGATIVLILALFVFGDQVADLLLAKSYRPGAKEIMCWIAAGYGFTVLAQVLEVQILALGDSRVLLWTKLAGAVANLALAIAIVPIFGVIGAARANVAGQLFQFAVTFWFGRHLQRKRDLQRAGSPQEAS